MAELSNYDRPNVTYDLNLKLMHLLRSDPREYDDNPASDNSNLGMIEILLTEKAKIIFSYPLDNGLTKFGIDEYTRTDSRVHVNSIENLYWFHNTVNYVTHMLNQLKIHNSMESLVVETAKAAARNPEGFQSFKVVADLEVNIDQGTLVSERYIINADSYDTHKSVEDSDDQNSDIIDEYGMSESDDELDLDVEQSIEDMKVHASKSAIDGLKRREYFYEGGADSLPKNSTGSTTADSVVCMDNFKVGTVVTYMPCSHFFHEVSLVQWLQEGNSCPLCRFQISSSD
ncbi:hypothetical protein MKX01_016126 [Papaver californicum]|nr:hypothetical protein MKX01_016126 [Papaver californicum]